MLPHLQHALPCLLQVEQTFLTFRLGSASVVLMSYNNMQDVLKASLFKTENDTVKTMLSKVVSIILPRTQDKTLTDGVNITFQHVKVRLQFVSHASFNSVRIFVSLKLQLQFHLHLRITCTTVPADAVDGLILECDRIQCQYFYMSSR